MKRLLLLLSLLAGTSYHSFAQLGKLLYEDAEQHYSDGKYAEALKLLKEAEKTSGKTNPLIEHIRILSRLELAKRDPIANYNQVEVAKNEAKVFLNKYDGDARVEDKFRDIYKALKELNAFPDKVGLAKLDEQKKATAVAAIEIKNIINWAQQKATSYKWNPDKTEAEFIGLNSDTRSYRWNRYNYKGGTLVARDVGRPMSVAGYITEGPSSYFFNDKGIVTGYIYTTHKGKDVADKYNQTYRSLVDEMITLAGSLGGSLVTQNDKGWTMIGIPASPNNPDKIEYYIRVTVSHVQKWSSIAISFQKEKDTPIWL